MVSPDMPKLSSHPRQALLGLWGPDLASRIKPLKSQELLPGFPLFGFPGYLSTCWCSPRPGTASQLIGGPSLGTTLECPACSRVVSRACLCKQGKLGFPCLQRHTSRNLEGASYKQGKLGLPAYRNVPQKFLGSVSTGRNASPAVQKMNRRDNRQSVSPDEVDQLAQNRSQHS